MYRLITFAIVALVVIYLSYVGIYSSVFFLLCPLVVINATPMRQPTRNALIALLLLQSLGALALLGLNRFMGAFVSFDVSVNRPSRVVSNTILSLPEHKAHHEEQRLYRADGRATSYKSHNRYNGSDRVIERRYNDGYINSDLLRLFNTSSSMPVVTFPDLRIRAPEEVRRGLLRVFQEVPADGFDPSFRNPCWIPSVEADKPALACLPYAYILGQPKCGTSDLFERLKAHRNVRMPRRKEVRWFTRGEFTTTKMEVETGDDASSNNRRLGPHSSIFTFTSQFASATAAFKSNPRELITIDGGPHTLWWPTQNSDGTLEPADIPIPQILKQLQPQARFIITLADPVRRLFSDYHFLKDDLRVMRPNDRADIKSPQQFHERAVSQIQRFRGCVRVEIDKLRRNSDEVNSRAFEEGEILWFRASQICAHDRHSFGVAGWGRINIGLYVLFIAKWLEVFPLSQFLIVRLEDYAHNPEEYMRKIFDFLGLDEPSADEWERVLRARHANEHKLSREPMLPATEVMLREFHTPYNKILSQLLKSDKFLWFQDRNGEPTPYKFVAQSNQKTINEFNGLKPRNRSAPRITNQKMVSNPMNRHGASADREYSNNTPFPVSLVGADSGASNLRSRSTSVILQARRFSIDDLPTGPSDEIAWWITGVVRKGSSVETEDDAAKRLCAAAVALDIPAIKHLLYEVGVSPNLQYRGDYYRDALTVLSMTGMFADGNGKSFIFDLLKGKDSWLSPYMRPPLQHRMTSVHTADILNSMNDSVIAVAQWLYRAGAKMDSKDVGENTALHFASLGGLRGLVQFLLDKGSNPNAVNMDGRTPLISACALGRVEIARALLAKGADWNIKDKYNVSALDIISAPGPISAELAHKYFGIRQQSVRRIQRLLQPELYPNDSVRGWAAGTGGWGPERLAGYERDMECDIDEYFAHEISGREIFDKYVARNSPVLIRGLIDHWPAVHRYTVPSLVANHGTLDVQVSDIPYSSKFGGSAVTQMTLGDYVKNIRDHNIIGGRHPWYVFRGHPIPAKSETEDSLVKSSFCPLPDTIKDTFILMEPTKGQSPADPMSYFMNAQFAVGGEGTGAPVHFHNTAWSALVYGAKKWLLYPPDHQIMSNTQILEFFESEKSELQQRGASARTCVQTAGDVMIIPESWGHGVLNIQESVVVATEVKSSLFRMRPGTHMLDYLPNDNRRNGRHQA